MRIPKPEEVKKMKNIVVAVKSSLVGGARSFSAVISTLGSSWNVCHAICTAVLSFLAGFGIVIAGFPLFFLFEYSIPLWAIALALFLVSLILFFTKKKCMPKNLLLFNGGVLIAGIPSTLVNLQPFSWIIGGIIALIAITKFLFSRFKKKEREKK